ncbi:MAG: integrin alpha [Planctomycetota bacterium]
MSRARAAITLVALGTLVPASVAQLTPTTLFKVNGSAGNALGAAARGAGDVNKDGYQDVAVGAPEEAGTGVVKVYSGKDGSLVWTFAGNTAGDRFGLSVSGAGDLDQDGYSDVLVGAPQTTTGNGYVQVFSGRTGAVLLTAAGKTIKDLFGFAVSDLGDVDQDSVPDIAVGAPSDFPFATGYVQVISGKTGAVIATLNGQNAGDQFGASVRRAGRVDGDACPDLIVGAPGFNGSIGYAKVYSGCTRSEIYTFAGPTPLGYFGYAVSSAGDVDHDGRDDLLVGVPGDDLGGADAGSVCVFSGMTGALLTTSLGVAQGGIFGAAVSEVGDVNNDGYGDFVVGAPFYCGSATDRGYARVLTVVGSSCVTLYEMTGDVVGDAFGLAVSAGGDVNQDGFDDFLVLAPCDSSSGALSGSFRLYSGRVCPSSWNNYGAGYPGTNGVPSLTSSDIPVICRTIDLIVTNSLGSTLPALFIAGVTPGSIPNPSGGTVLVSPPWVLQPFVLPGAGASLPFTVLCDTAFCGLTIYLQVLEQDPGAGGPHQDVSSTPGLALVLGGF